MQYLQLQVEIAPNLEGHSRSNWIPYSPVSHCRIMGVYVVVLTGRNLVKLFYDIAGSDTGGNI